MKYPKILTLAAVIVGVVLMAFWFYKHRYRNLVTFLKESPAAQLSLIQIGGNFEGKPRSVVISEPETLKYVTAILRKPATEHKFGCVYAATLTFKGGEESQITLDIPEGGKSLCIGVEKGWMEDLDHYGVDLVEPLPKGLKDALIQLTSVEYIQTNQYNLKK